MNRLRVLGVSLMALCALGAALSTSAFAAGPPENTVLPALQFATPKVWVTYTTTRGTWTNEPTAYAYQWERCNPSGGECVAIAGGTEKNYEVIPADQGHSLRVTVTASNAAGKGSAVSLPSKMAAKGPEFVPSTHSYENVNFLFHGGASFETGNKSVTCETLSGQGAIVSPTEVSGARVTLSGCRGGTFTCTTMESAPLHGYIAYINAATKAVGIELGGATSAFSETWRCNGIVTHLTGQLIGEITSVNLPANVFSLTYKQSKGVQNPNHLESGSTQQLEWDFGFVEHWALASTDVFSTNVKGEFVAP
jgi:hypothetical protein